MNWTRSFTSRPAELAILVIFCLSTPGCAPPRDSSTQRRISWTGAPAPIEQMVFDYVHGVKVPPENRPTIFDARYYAPPTPFFLFQGNDDALTAALAARVGSSDPPVDIYYIDLYWFMNFESEWLSSLQAATLEIDNKPWLLREALAPGMREACELEDELYALPLSIRGNCLYYRADLVSEPPHTWPELIAMAKQVLAAQPPGSPLRYGLTFHWQELHTDLYPILWGYGGGPPCCLDAHGNLDRSLADEANLRALAMFYDLVHRERLTASIAELKARGFEAEKNLFQQFAEGSTVFSIDWTNRAARIAENLRAAPTDFDASHIGIGPIPHGPESDRSFATIGSWGWVVAAEPRSPHSLEFVKQMASPGAQLYFFEKHAEVPIYRESLLYQLQGWPKTEARLTTYHRQLLELVHGQPNEPGVELRDRPGRKQVNRIILEALQDVLSLEEVTGAATGLDLASARARLAQADRDILAFLKQLESLDGNVACDPDMPLNRSSPAVRLERGLEPSPAGRAPDETDKKGER